MCMRILAALLFSAAGVLAGRLLQDRLRRRMLTADALCRMVQEISARALYLHQPLPQITAALAQDVAFADALPFLADCVNRCGQSPFPAAWQCAAEAFLRTGCLPAQQTRLLGQLGGALASADERQLSDLLAWYADQFRALLLSSQRTLESAGKRYMYLCSAGGILLGILIL